MRPRLLAAAAVVVLAGGLGGCAPGSGTDGILMVGTAPGEPGTTAAVSETTPPTTVVSEDPLLRLLVSTEWEVVSLDGRTVAETFAPFVLRFRGDGTFRFTGACPVGSHGTSAVDRAEIRFDSDVDAAVPAIGCLPVDDLLQGRLMSITDHGVDVSTFSDREILARTVLPRAFDVVLRPSGGPSA